MDIEFKLRDTYLEVAVGNEYSFSSFYAVLPRCAEEARRSNRTLILINAMRLIGIPEDFERFELGVKAAEELHPPFVTLLLAKREAINKFGETVAVNRGAIVLSTWDREAGMKWLLEKGRGQPAPAGRF